MIDSTLGSSNPVVSILTEVSIALGVSLNHFSMLARSFFVVVLSRCAMGIPARLNKSYTNNEVLIPLLKIKVFFY